MSPNQTVICLLLFTASSVAQISVSMDVPMPIDVICTEGTLTQSATQPSGPSNFFNLFTYTQNTSAALAVSAVGDDLSARINVSLTALRNVIALNGSSAVGPASVLLQLSLPSTTPVTWQAGFTDQSTPGSPVPSFDIDVGDDGIVDFINGVRASLTIPTAVGPQPLPVRILFSSSLQQFGYVNGSMSLDVLPDTAIQTTTVATGCAGGGAAIGATPTFLGDGVRLQGISFYANTPWLALVVGGGVQPLLLPSFNQFPCLFVPTPDVIMLQTLTTPGIDVPLPAGLRPVTFWIQGVIPDSQLLTTDCVRIDAR